MVKQQLIPNHNASFFGFPGNLNMFVLIPLLNIRHNNTLFRLNPHESYIKYSQCSTIAGELCWLSLPLSAECFMYSALFSSEL
jgi:hypothetical protein